MPNDTICLLNDSFPPLIDGVANTVMNYAEVLSNTDSVPVVITPSHPDADDSRFPYRIVRYPGINLYWREGYVAGIPFSPEVAGKVRESNVSILHSHCPFMSTILAREIRPLADAPIVFTYHTKFDIDIRNEIKNKQLQNALISLIVENISACDEVWAVSQGAGENLRSLGYEGDYVVMSNGVDLPHETVSPDEIASATKGYDLPDGVPVFLYVGRMMWYKGIRIIIDALDRLAREGRDFRMVFIGLGDEAEEIIEYAMQSSLENKCIFAGAIRDRRVLRAWYCRSDLFLFPSTYDTNGLVVREAAACNLASILIDGSCAAEGVTDGRNGFLISENADSLCRKLCELSDDLELCHRVGKGAGDELYISWEDSVTIARKRYERVIERYASGEIPKRTRPADTIMKINGSIMDAMSKIICHFKKYPF